VYLLVIDLLSFYTATSNPAKMKIAVLLSAFAGASAFAPASQSSVRGTSALNAADLSSMRGVGPETGGKVVSLGAHLFL
jgi:hypothetical protein